MGLYVHYCNADALLVGGEEEVMASLEEDVDIEEVNSSTRASSLQEQLAAHPNLTLTAALGEYLSSQPDLNASDVSTMPCDLCNYGRGCSRTI